MFVLLTKLPSLFAGALSKYEIVDNRAAIAGTECKVGEGPWFFRLPWLSVNVRSVAQITHLQAAVEAFSSVSTLIPDRSGLLFGITSPCVKLVPHLLTLGYRGTNVYSAPVSPGFWASHAIVGMAGKTSAKDFVRSTSCYRSLYARNLPCSS